MDTTKVFELSSDIKPVVRRAGQKRFGSSDICDILKACYDSKVTKLSFDGLTVEFEGKINPPLKDQVQIPKEQTQQSQTQNKDRLVALGSKVDEALDQLEIEDPFAAERFAISEDSISAERSTAPEQ
jgi:hypothetical protein